MSLATITEDVAWQSSHSIGESGPSTLPPDALLTSRKKQVEYVLRRNGQSLRVRAEQPVPSWLDQSLRRLQEILLLEDNWNSYGAQRVGIDPVYAAIEVLVDVSTKSTPAPSIVPTVDRGVQLEWHEEGIDLEIEVISRVRSVVCFADVASGEEWEDDLDSDLPRVRRYLARLSK